MKTVFTIFRDAKREFRWHAKRSGRIVACSGEGYKRRMTCRRTLTRLAASLAVQRYEIRNEL